MFDFFEFMSNEEVTYFDFRIINLPGGNQVIDPTIKTPVDALTPEMQEEYMEVHTQLAIAERMRKKECREAERKEKRARNPLYRVACMCGMV